MNQKKGDYFIPCVVSKDQKEVHIGVWANRHRQYLKQFHRVRYYNLLTSERLYGYLVVTLCGCSHENEQVKLLDTVEQIQGMEDYEPFGTLSKSFSENVVYEVKNISWTGNSGVAEVEVTTPDLGKIISNSIQVTIDEYGIKDYNELLSNVKENIQAVLSSEDYPILKNSVEMDAEKAEDGYTLISNEEFEKIISGNLEEIFIQALMEGLAHENSN